MSEGHKLTGGKAEELEQMLSPRVEIGAVAEEKDPEKLNELVFELYKEALSVVNLAAHLLDDDAAAKGGWVRNQAVCAGLMIRISKFMLVVTQLSATKNRAEVVHALNRSILESATNLEFLAMKNDGECFEQFVKFSLGPERALHDLIQKNIAERGGEIQPIEKRMLESIDRVCSTSGVKIEEVNQKYGDWGGGVRERLKALNKQELYVGVQRIPSHAVHGTWVDLVMNHLDYDAKNGVFMPDPDFGSVDARLLGPVAIFVLDATKVYLQRFFAHIPESELLFERIDDLSERIFRADAAHENVMNQ
jgi:Family of unknown function (DUF5677)